MGAASIDVLYLHVRSSTRLCRESGYVCGFLAVTAVLVTALEEFSSTHRADGAVLSRATDCFKEKLTEMARWLHIRGGESLFNQLNAPF